MPGAPTSSSRRSHLPCKCFHLASLVGSGRTWKYIFKRHQNLFPAWNSKAGGPSVCDGGCQASVQSWAAYLWVLGILEAQSKPFFWETAGHRVKGARECKSTNMRAYSLSFLTVEQSGKIDPLITSGFNWSVAVEGTDNCTSSVWRDSREGCFGECKQLSWTGGGGGEETGGGVGRRKEEERKKKKEGGRQERRRVGREEDREEMGRREGKREGGRETGEEGEARVSCSTNLTYRPQMCGGNSTAGSWVTFLRTGSKVKAQDQT